jgi:hypothetical protein
VKISSLKMTSLEGRGLEDRDHTNMKKRSLGCPSSARRNNGFANEVKSCRSRADADTPICLKYGARFDRAIMSAGYKKVRLPEVVATIE